MCHQRYLWHTLRTDFSEVQREVRNEKDIRTPWYHHFALSPSIGMKFVGIPRRSDLAIIKDQGETARARNFIPPSSAQDRDLQFPLIVWTGSLISLTYTLKGPSSVLRYLVHSWINYYICTVVEFCFFVTHFDEYHLLRRENVPESSHQAISCSDREISWLTIGRAVHTVCRNMIVDAIRHVNTLQRDLLDNSGLTVRDIVTGQLSYTTPSVTCLTLLFVKPHDARWEANNTFERPRFCNDLGLAFNVIIY